MTLVGLSYHVLNGDPIPKGKGQFLGENVEAHCKVMGHSDSTVHCAKTAEPIVA